MSMHWTPRDDFTKTVSKYSSMASREGKVLLHWEDKIIVLNPSQISFTDHSQGASLFFFGHAMQRAGS